LIGAADLSGRASYPPEQRGSSGADRPSGSGFPGCPDGRVVQDGQVELGVEPVIEADPGQVLVPGVRRHLEVGAE
jgi:hypothetical protein